MTKEWLARNAKAPSSTIMQMPSARYAENCESLQLANGYGSDNPTEPKGYLDPSRQPR